MCAYSHWWVKIEPNEKKKKEEFQNRALKIAQEIRFLNSENRDLLNRSNLSICFERERRMASSVRKANTQDERDLLEAAEKGDWETLTSLLQKGVCSNVHKSFVW